MNLKTALNRKTMLFVGLAAIVVPSTGAAGEIASALLREDDEVLPGETVSALSNTGVNHVGGYSCTVNTGTTPVISRIWGNATGGPGLLLRSEQTIGNLEQTSFESFFGMSDGGLLGYSAISNEIGGPTGLDGAWLDSTVVLNEEDPVPSLPGQYSSFNSRVSVSGGGTIVWVGGITTTPGTATQNRCLFSGPGATVLIKGGDFLPGIAEPVSTSSGMDFDFRVSRFDTYWISQIFVTSASAQDGVMVINGEPISAGGGMMREGQPVPAALGGLPNELWANFDFLGINEAGDFFVTGDTSADVGLDEFVSKNGQIVLREGDTLALGGSSVTISGAIEGGYMNQQGDWAVTWDVDDDAAVNLEALIFNGEIVLAEGDLVDWNGDGVIDAGDNNAVLTDFTGISALTVGSRVSGLVKIYFTADADVQGVGVREGFFCLEVQADSCPWDCGDGNSDVGVVDFLAMLAQWGQAGASCDFDNDGVSVVDFLALLAHWGPCP